MGQSRNKSGVEFEKQICESNNWNHQASSPRIFWEGIGSSNFQKIKNANFDLSVFKPNLEKSKFTKFDAIDTNNNPVEIKKYTMDQMSEWRMYSEPIFKVASKTTMKSVTKLFGDGDYDKSVEVYNTFVSKIVDTIG